ncbi:MAG: Flp pilus assembly complex ATPase component TadA [Hydrogenovibrio crunogenus]|uniref:Type II secretion pathway protein E homolog n=1 Tax=Hydrogenovibrio crunogenus (strain DSM 25203 / XCL-2) TaxID=317025 RepID=Q31HY6_HYDCU|nr:Flp pilus assembly complex ATPase component TadA [Hydrogenovibrio crunogenus]
MKGEDRLGEHLVQEGLISQDQLRIALMEQKITGKKLGEILITLDFLTEEVSRKVVGSAVGYSTMSLKGVVPDLNALRLISESFARANLVMPISFDGELLKVGMTSPDDILLLDKIKRHIKQDVRLEPVLVVENEIQYSIDHFYGYELSIDGILRELETGQADDYVLSEQHEYSQPMVRLVDSILTDAVKRGASDVHFEPEEYYIRIRYRIDGVLQVVRLLHKSFWSGLVVRLKVMSDLDLTDQRMPQDGRMELVVNGRQIDFRVSSFPTSHGENFVLRILDREKGIMPLDALGLDVDSYRELKLMMSRPTGIVLVTGPTGSGKTTTLYSLLNEINQEGVNIMTLEDPVEYPMKMIRQTAVNEEIGMTFATGIRSLMRQDPDIVLIGEIRDSETAEMALRAAMTGHQVFTTLHTNSAIGAIPRLLDIGMSRSILAGNVIGILAQRLARRLCPHCKEPYEPDGFEKRIVGFSENQSATLYRAAGCPICNGIGYKGRLAVLEILRFSSEMDDLLLEGASQHDILDQAVEQGFTDLLQNALRWVRSGDTTLDEISRIVDLTELV